MPIMELQDRPTRPFRPGAIMGGAVLLALGAALLLDRTGMLQLNHLVAPSILIVIGALITLERSAFVCSTPVRDENGSVEFEARLRRPTSGGLWLIVLGIWMLISQNHLWGFTFETSWPLLIVFMGAMVVVRGWR
jgi:hypothetical protein